MYKKILAPLDGSEVAECTLAHTKAIAKGCKVPKVVLLRVIEPLSTGGAEEGEIWSRDEEAFQATVKDYLSGVADSLKKEGISVETTVVSGKAADEILDYAKNNQVDLVVMCTHGKSGISRWFLGSVSERVAHHSPVPLLLIAPPGRRAG